MSATNRSLVVPLWVLAVIAVLFFFREARNLLIPIALAVLISYALAPVVSWLERHRVPRLAGAGLVLLSILAAAAGSGYALRSEVKELVEAVPRALERGRDMVRTRLGFDAAPLENSSTATDSRSRTSDGANQQAEAGSRVTGSLVQEGFGAVFSLAGHLVVIFFLVYFLLISGHHARDRLVESLGSTTEDRRTVSTIIDEINAQIQRYLLVLLVTATTVGVSTWLVLSWMGVGNAVAWGTFAGVFNSIPYFGPVVVSGGLFVVGLVQGGGMTEALQMAGASIVITSLEGWLMTPALMGKAERMSALVVFLGLLLWTWIWGAWGTVLAVPMLVVMKSVADHVRTLKPLGRLMAPY